MATQIEIDTMRALIALNKEYRKQNSFVELTTFQKTYNPLTGEVHFHKKKDLLRVSDISYIEETDDGMDVYIHDDKKFLISRKEFKEKLSNFISLV